MKSLPTNRRLFNKVTTKNIPSYSIWALGYKNIDGIFRRITRQSNFLCIATTPKKLCRWRIYFCIHVHWPRLAGMPSTSRRLATRIPRWSKNISRWKRHASRLPNGTLIGWREREIHIGRCRRSSTPKTVYPREKTAHAEWSIDHQRYKRSKLQNPFKRISNRSCNFHFKDLPYSYEQ